MTKSTKKRAPQQTGERPVLQFRVHESVYADLKKAAAAKKLSISGEVARRLDRYAEHAAAMDDVRAMMREHSEWQKRDFESQLQNAGFTPIVGTEGTVWAEPGMKAVGNIHGAALHPEIIATIEAAVTRAMKKASE